MLAFLFTPDADLVVEDDALAAVAKDAAQSRRGARRRDAALGAARRRGPPRTIEAALRAALVEGLGLKPKVAFGPLRVAVTGRRVSPPLFESMEILGRESTLARLAALRGRLGV